MRPVGLALTTPPHVALGYAVIPGALKNTLTGLRSTMHVDGFRFDLASILERDEAGAVMPSPPVLWDMPAPVAETVQDHPPHDGMIGVERVAGAAVVRVARAVSFEDVVRRIVQSAEAQGRSAVVAFRAVVEHHVQDDLEAGAMQRLDHVAELVDGTNRVST